MKKLAKLEDNQAWKDCNEIAAYVYSKLSEMPSDEDWNTTRKLRDGANNLVFYVAEALGGGMAPNGAVYEWNNVRKTSSSLKTMYRFACKQKFIELEPEIMVKLGKLIALSEAEIKKATKKAKQLEVDELKPWFEKYRLWKEMQK